MAYIGLSKCRLCRLWWRALHRARAVKCDAFLLPVYMYSLTPNSLSVYYYVLPLGGLSHLCYEYALEYSQGLLNVTVCMCKLRNKMPGRDQMYEKREKGLEDSSHELGVPNNCMGCLHILFQCGGHCLNLPLYSTSSIRNVWDIINYAWSILRLGCLP